MFVMALLPYKQILRGSAEQRKCGLQIYRSESDYWRKCKHLCSPKRYYNYEETYF